MTFHGSNNNLVPVLAKFTSYSQKLQKIYPVLNISKFFVCFLTILDLFFNNYNAITKCIQIP